MSLFCFRTPSRFLWSLIGLAVLSFTASAQAPVNDFSTQGWWQPANGPFSPVVHPDRRITFRIKAPKATQVALQFGEWQVKPQPMRQDTAGTWQITIGPVEPDIYAYTFSVDGVEMPDMANPVTKTGTQFYSSIVEVPGNPPRFDEMRRVPHGLIAVHHYYSDVMHQLRSCYIYLPPGYAQQPDRKFPVLYLRHGGGDHAASWSQPAGSAGTILDNLLADGRAVPMIIVMPEGLTADGSWAGGSTPEGMKNLAQELLQEVMPWVEKNYRVLTGPQNTAMTGLSMGGGQAMVMGLRHPEKFGWIGEFSSGLLSDKDLQIDSLLPGRIQVSLNQQLHLLWIGCGRDDPRYPGHLALTSLLKKRGIHFVFDSEPGGHEWKVWRLELHGFLQKVFQP